MASVNKATEQTPKKFQSSVALIGGSNVDWNYFKTLKTRPIVAIDGGANPLKEQNLKPELICGDFDSLNPSAKSFWCEKNIPFIPLPDQNHTDFCKALSLIQAPEILAFGFLGARLDHSLDALAQIAKRPDQTIYLIGEDDIAFVLPSGQPQKIQTQNRISFWSIGASQIIASKGLKWPLESHELSAAHMSISNKTTEQTILVEYKGAPLIAITQINAINLE